MCGIVGRFNFDGKPVDEDIIRQMCSVIKHRGPDDEGIYLNRYIGLGIRRLSIIDIEGGHQPISNEDKSIWLVCNGEIYNFPELRDYLLKKGHCFYTSTDIEVIVHLYEEFGESFISKLNGMFAFAIWDTHRSRLIIARDRLGQKPLYYRQTEDSISFASELQALLRDREPQSQVNPIALLQYLKLWYIPSPNTIFQGVKKLPPANILICDRDKVNKNRYWKLDFYTKKTLSLSDWGERILELLHDCVRMRLMSDVPLGAFLSGGIDSSLIIALMTKIWDQPIKTFSIGFEEETYNELPHAQFVSDQLGTEHYKAVVQPDAAEILPTLMRHYGEPFGDDSCIPSYYLSKFARKKVTVALSGDGGDECFGGYPRLARHHQFNSIDSLRGLFAGGIKSLINGDMDLKSLTDANLWLAFLSELRYRIIEIMDPIERYSNAWSAWKGIARDVVTPELKSAIHRGQVLEPLDVIFRETRGWHSMDRYLYLDIHTYLPDDLQVKMDIASMANSLEVRSPFLDYRLMELTASLPHDEKIKNGKTKVIFKKIASSILPSRIVNRSKRGFSMPPNYWLQGRMKQMLTDLLLDRKSRDRGIFQVEVIEQMIDAHTDGRNDYGRNLWLLLIFEIWARELLDSQ